MSQEDEDLKNCKQAKKGRGPKRLNPRHFAMLRMAAVGRTQADFCRELDLDQSRASIIMNSDLFQIELKRLQGELFNDHMGQFERLTPLAICAAEEILRNPLAKEGSKLRAAELILDRSLGKPKQTVEQQGSLLREIFAHLNKRDNEEDKDTTECLNLSAEDIA